MPIAKRTLRIEGVVAAVEGSYITKATVKAQGWGSDDVTDGPDIGGDGEKKTDKKASAT